MPAMISCSGGSRQRHDAAPARVRVRPFSQVRRRRTNGASTPTCSLCLQQDVANVEAGLYPLPGDHDGSLLTRLYRSRLFFADLPEIHRRRECNGFREVLSEKTRGRRPDYYLQNFHFQSGGWMSDDSADRYDAS